MRRTAFGPLVQAAYLALTLGDFEPVNVSNLIVGNDSGATQ
jgi:hypothetical protein